MKSSAAQRMALAERELRQGSFHEAGHACMCRHFGGVGVAEVWRNSKIRVKAGERAWLGTFKMYARPGAASMDAETRAALGVEFPPPENWRVLVGMAGLVAEKIADGITSVDEVFGFIRDTIDSEEASATDLHMMGSDWSESDVEQVLRRLLKLWPELEMEANSLMADA